MADALCVAPDDVPRALSLIGHYIDEGMRRGGLEDASIVRAGLLNGKMLLWLAVEDRQVLGAAVTQLCEAHGRKFGVIVSLGGKNYREWGHLISRLEDWARAEGAQAMRIYGRHGWERALSDYRRIAVVIEKDLA